LFAVTDINHENTGFGSSDHVDIYHNYHATNNSYHIYYEVQCEFGRDKKEDLVTMANRLAVWLLVCMYIFLCAATLVEGAYRISLVRPYVRPDIWYPQLLHYSLDITELFMDDSLDYVGVHLLFCF
jgi:hypothetical protein